MNSVLKSWNFWSEDDDSDHVKGSEVAAKQNHHAQRFHG
jgi:hypothetical protein